jgi:DNA mismatch repair protein MutS
MTELRGIIKRTRLDGQTTLVIGDEICRGTETQSAVSIVCATLLHLLKSKANFIFATHLHQLAKIDTLIESKKLRIRHLSVEYDDVDDKLIYSRELKEGSGPEVYGVMVAKYVIRDDEFIDLVDSIGNVRKDTLPKSRYNKDVIMSKCEMCGYMPFRKTDKELETHHLNPQRDTDKDGMLLKFPHVHKNHKSNLIVLCRPCHMIFEKYYKLIDIKESSYGRVIYGNFKNNVSPKSRQFVNI